MEEEKAAAYYDELTRKGEGAARFKQGLGFSSSASNDDVPKPGSALASSSSFFSKFVKASSPSNPPKPSESEKKAQLQSIQDKLKKKPTSESRVSEKTSHGSYSSRDRERDSDRSRRRSRSRSRSRERYRERGKESRRRSRSRERYRYRDRDRSRSDSDGKHRERERGRRRSRSRSASPRKQRRSEKNSSDVRDRGKVSEISKGKSAAGVDYAKLIEVCC